QLHRPSPPVYRGRAVASAPSADRAGSRVSFQGGCQSMSVFLLVLALLQQPGLPPGAGSDVIRGVVTDVTGAPVAGVDVVVLSGTSRSVGRTAADGAWSAAVPSGATMASLHVEVAGFAPLTRAVTLPAQAVHL